jgi:hypothetical protein
MKLPLDARITFLGVTLALIAGSYMLRNRFGAGMACLCAMLGVQVVFFGVQRNYAMAGVTAVVCVLMTWATVHMVRHPPGGG